jgi:hypothetical protein
MPSSNMLVLQRHLSEHAGGANSLTGIVQSVPRAQQHVVYRMVGSLLAGWLGLL